MVLLLSSYLEMGQSDHRQKTLSLVSAPQTNEQSSDLFESSQSLT